MKHIQTDTSYKLELEFPEFFIKIFPTLCEINPHLLLKLKNQTLILSLKNSTLAETSSLKLELPSRISENEIEQLLDLNPGLKLEWEENFITIYMSTLGFRGVFTAAILITLGIWNKRKKLGRIVDSSTGHDLFVKGKKNS